MGFIKGLFRAIVGAIFGLLSTFALVPAFAAFRPSQDAAPSPWIWGVAVAGFLLGIFAPTIRRAFGRGFLLLGASVFALPLSMLLLSSRVSSEMVAAASPGQQGMTAVGAGFGSVLMTGAAGFIGFFLGSILLIIGLVLSLGGRREVIIVNRQ